MLSVAADQGDAQAEQELFFLSGVKVLMDRKDPDWLEREKARVVGATP